MAESTPGPWYAEGDYVYAVRPSGYTRPITRTYSQYHGSPGIEPDAPCPEAEANAALCAAAPDLLAACQRAVALYELIISDHPDLDPDRELPPELDVLRAAIARARGG